MTNTKEELQARKKEILNFLSKHFKRGTEKFINFVSKYPDYSESDLNQDPSSEANEVADYEVSLEIEHAMENELIEIDEKLKQL